MKCRLFVGSTGYHLLLFEAIIRGTRSYDEEYLLFMPKSHSHFEFFRNIYEERAGEKYKGYFVKVFSSKEFKRYYQKLRWCSVENEVEKIITKNDTSIFTSNDKRIEIQYLMSMCQNCSYVEDGNHAYDDNRVSTPSNVYEEALKILAGKWIDFKEVYGRHKLITDAWLTKPDKVREELKLNNINKINQPSKKLKSEWSKLVDQNINIKEGAKHLIVLPKSDSIVDTKNIKKFINRIVENKNKYLIKYHPSESKKYAQEVGIKEVQRCIPIELFLADEGIESVYVHTKSTVSYSLGWLGFTGKIKEITH